MAMNGLERKALFKAAVTLRELTMAEAAAKLGVSYNHLTLVLRGDRVGSAQLERRITQFVGKSGRELFGDYPRVRKGEEGGSNDKDMG
jgi:transcriptional regulator with XRE-family HTH domain